MQQSSFSKRFLIIIDPECRKISVKEEFELYLIRLNQLGFVVIEDIPSIDNFFGLRLKYNISKEDTVLMITTDQLEHLRQFAKNIISYCHPKCNGNLIIQLPYPNDLISTLIPKCMNKN